ncbi:MAG: hypothetical protein ACI4NM_00615 [Bullifex sp.]
MKKRIISVCVLLTVTLFMFVSCSGSITDTLLKVMDSTNVNVYEKTGMVKPDTSAADNALKAMESKPADITVAPDGEVKLEGDLEVLASVGNIKLSSELAAAASKGALAPQTAEQKAAFTSAINSATNEASQKALQDKMETVVTDEKEKNAVKGTMAITSGAINSAVSMLNVTETSSTEVKQVASILTGLSDQLAKVATDPYATITEADKVQAQLLTNIAVSAAKASEAIANSAGSADILENDDVKELVNDTLTLYATAKIASGSVDILQTEGLFDAFTNVGSKAAINIDSSKLDPKYLKVVINLIKNSLGTDSSKYMSKYNSYRNMVESRNLTYAVVGANKNITDPSLKATATTGSVLELMNAAIFSTILDPAYKVKVNDTKFAPLCDIIIDIVQSSPKMFTEYELASDSYSYYLNKLIGGASDANGYKDLAIDILERLQGVAVTADNMLISGGLNVSDLLSALKISSGGETIDSIGGWLQKIIDDMKASK